MCQSKPPVFQTNSSTSAPPLRESSSQLTEDLIQRETVTATANADYPSKPGYFDVEFAPPRPSPGYYDVEEAPPRSGPGYFDVEESPPQYRSVDSTSDSSSECSYKSVVAKMRLQHIIVKPL